MTSSDSDPVILRGLTTQYVVTPKYCGILSTQKMHAHLKSANFNDGALLLEFELGSVPGLDLWTQYSA